MRKLSCFWHRMKVTSQPPQRERALIAQEEEDEDVCGTDGMPTRKSTRSRKQVKDNNYRIVLV